MNVDEILKLALELGVKIEHLDTLGYYWMVTRVVDSVKDGLIGIAVVGFLYYGVKLANELLREDR